MTTYYLTALAAKDSVRDWDLTCLLLQETLFSLEQQSSPNFRSIVCCHDIPAFASKLDSRFTFLTHPYAPPSNAYANTGQNNGIRDMMLKRDVALHAASPAASDWVVLLDADDLFHRNLTSELEQQTAAQGALLEHGYELCQKSRKLLPRRDMVGRTTSSFALRGGFVRTPQSADECDLKKSIYHEVWHSNVRQYLQANLLAVWEPQAPRVIYRVNTTLNRSDWYRVSKMRRWRHHLKFLLGRKVSDADRSDFAVDKFVGRAVGAC